MAEVGRGNEEMEVRRERGNGERGRRERERGREGGKYGLSRARRKGTARREAAAQNKTKHPGLVLPFFIFWCRCYLS